MTNLDAYATFLTARWDEMERDLGVVESGLLEGQHVSDVVPLTQGGALAIYMLVRHDPATIRRDLASKRAILVEHQPEGVDFGDEIPGLDGVWGCSTCSEMVEHGSSRGGEWPCPTIEALAAPFRDHPDHPANR